MKKQSRKHRSARGSIEQVRGADLGGGRRLEVLKLTPPRDPEILARMESARQAMERGDATKAVILAREIWRRGHGDKFVGVWVGQMLAKYGECDEAMRVYCACEGLEAGCWEAYWQLGIFLLSNGHHGRAVEFLREAVRIEPSAVDPYLDLARCLTALGRAEEARRALTEAQALDPEATL